MVAHPTEPAIILATAAGMVHASQTAQGLQPSYPASAVTSCYTIRPSTDSAGVVVDELGDTFELRTQRMY